MYSVINLAVWSWTYILITNIYKNHRISEQIYFILLLFVSILGGLILSFVIGVIIQKRLIGKIAKIFHMTSVDPIDSSWDWLFSRSENIQMVITFKDNSVICGWYGKNSFTSSDPNERDMFVEYTYKIDENGNYQDDPESKGIYISKDQIKYIDIKQPKENSKNE
jgi:hypothetical protein